MDLCVIHANAHHAGLFLDTISCFAVKNHCTHANSCTCSPCHTSMREVVIEFRMFSFAECYSLCQLVRGLS